MQTGHKVILCCISAYTQTHLICMHACTLVYVHCAMMHLHRTRTNFRLAYAKRRIDTHTHAPQPKLYNQKSSHPEKYFGWNGELKLCVDFAIFVVGGVFTSLWNIKRINFKRANDKKRVKNGVRKILTTNLKLGISLCVRNLFKPKHEPWTHIEYGWSKGNETKLMENTFRWMYEFYFILFFVSFMVWEEIERTDRRTGRQATKQASKRSKGICAKHWFAM